MIKDRSKTTILIVDDETPILHALKYRLEYARYTVMIAHDTASACVKAHECPPDIAVLDINLPGGNGFELAARLDRMSMKPVQKIFITASKRAEFRDQADMLGAAEFIEKPFGTEALFDALEKAEDRRKVFAYA